MLADVIKMFKVFKVFVVWFSSALLVFLYPNVFTDIVSSVNFNASVR